MDLMESSSDDKNAVETAALNEDFLVVLQTENGEQIALPMSALPSDFVPGDSGQIIMVESGLDEQQQEVVVESSDVNENQSITENLITLHPPEVEPQLTTLTNSNLDQMHASELATLDQSITDVQESNVDVNVIQMPASLSGDNRTTPRTYSKGSVVKSYAPTCGTTRIYQQPQQQQSQPQQQPQQQPRSQTTSKIEAQAHHEAKIDLENPETMTLSNVQVDTQSSNVTELEEVATDANNPNTTTLSTTTTTTQTITNIIEEPKPPHKKQKRKETLQTRPLNEEDMKLEFQIIEEPQPVVQEVEIKRKPRKEYKTKKKARLALEKLSKSEFPEVNKEVEPRERLTKKRRHESPKKDDMAQFKKGEVEEEAKKDEEADDEKPGSEEAKKDELKKESSRDSKKEIPRRELPKRSVKEKSNEPAKPPQKAQPPAPVPQQKQEQQQQQHPLPERRTRLSNACRDPLSKSYKCNDCDFSTDRINNIVLHVKESCPNLKRM